MRVPITHVITTKDRADHLSMALERAKGWKQADDELIVIDGSEHVDNWETVEKSGLVTEHLVELDDGIGDALNKGIGLATRSIIRVVNDDDWYIPGAVDLAVEAMEANPTISLLVCGGWRVWEPTVPTTRMIGHAICVPRGEDYGSHPHTVFKWGACGTGFLHRKELCIGYTTDYVMSDVDCALRHIEAGLDVRFLRANLFTHVVFPHSSISRDPRKTLRENAILRKKYGYKSGIEPKREYENPPVWDGEFA